MKKVYKLIPLTLRVLGMAGLIFNSLTPNSWLLFGFSLVFTTLGFFIAGMDFGLAKGFKDGYNQGHEDAKGELDMGKMCQTVTNTVNDMLRSQDADAEVFLSMTAEGLKQTPKPKPQPKREYNMDELLDKISLSGLGSLTEEEKEWMESKTK